MTPLSARPLASTSLRRHSRFTSSARSPSLSPSLLTLWSMTLPPSLTALPSPSLPSSSSCAAVRESRPVASEA
jgi:hypothetical protein